MDSAQDPVEDGVFGASVQEYHSKLIENSCLATPRAADSSSSASSRENTPSCNPFTASASSSSYSPVAAGASPSTAVVSLHSAAAAVSVHSATAAVQSGSAAGTVPMYFARSPASAAASLDAGVYSGSNNSNSSSYLIAEAQKQSQKQSYQARGISPVFIPRVVRETNAIEYCSNSSKNRTNSSRLHAATAAENIEPAAETSSRVLRWPVGTGSCENSYYTQHADASSNSSSEATYNKEKASAEDLYVNRVDSAPPAAAARLAEAAAKSGCTNAILLPGSNRDAGTTQALACVPIQTAVATAGTPTGGVSVTDGCGLSPSLGTTSSPQRRMQQQQEKSTSSNVERVRERRQRRDNSVSPNRASRQKRSRAGEEDGSAPRFFSGAAVSPRAATSGTARSSGGDVFTAVDGGNSLAMRSGEGSAGASSRLCSSFVSNQENNTNHYSNHSDYSRTTPPSQTGAAASSVFCAPAAAEGASLSSFCMQQLRPESCAPSSLAVAPHSSCFEVVAASWPVQSAGTAADSTAVSATEDLGMVHPASDRDVERKTGTAGAEGLPVFKEEEGQPIENLDLFGLAQYHCDVCSRDISNVCRIRCAECEDFDLCVPCFSTGKEVIGKPHRNFHSYIPVGRNAFPLLRKDWTADEEMMLLEGVSKYGFGNWNEVSELVNGVALKPKSSQQCSNHYSEVYLNSKTSPLPDTSLLLTNKDGGPLTEKDMQEDEKDSETDPHTSAAELEDLTARKLGANACAPAPRSGAPKPTHAIVGYWPLRGDFDVEYDNDAELILADMEFKENEAVQERQLKLQVIEIYNSKLDERIYRKRTVISRGLLDTKTLHQREKRRTKEERDLHNLFKPLARFHSDEEQERLVQLLIEEKRIRSRLAVLHEWKSLGLQTAEDVGAYEEEKLWREQLQRNKVAELANAAAGGGGSSRPTAGKHARRHAAALSGAAAAAAARKEGLRAALEGNIPISMYPGAKLLSEKELAFCEEAQLPPIFYLFAKRILIQEISVHKKFNATDFSKPMKLFVQRVGQLYDFYVNVSDYVAQPHMPATSASRYSPGSNSHYASSRSFTQGLASPSSQMPPGSLYSRPPKGVTASIEPLYTSQVTFPFTTNNYQRLVGFPGSTAAGALQTSAASNFPYEASSTNVGNDASTGKLERLTSV